MEQDPIIARRKIKEEVHAQWRKKLGFEDRRFLWALIITSLLCGPLMPSLVLKLVVMLAALSLLIVGVAIPEWIIGRRFRKWKKQLKLFEQSPSGKIHIRLREYQQELAAYQDKIAQYTEKISEGKTFRQELEEAQQTTGLSQNRKEKNQQLIQGLNKNIAQQQLLLQFYQESLSRLKQETLNLEHDLKQLEVMDYLQGQKEGAYEDHVELELTQLKTEFLDEIGRLESAIPDVESQGLSEEFQLQLEDMIRRLKGQDDEDNASDSLSAFSDLQG